MKHKCAYQYIFLPHDSYFIRFHILIPFKPPPVMYPAITSKWEWLKNINDRMYRGLLVMVKNSFLAYWTFKEIHV